VAKNRGREQVKVKVRRIHAAPAANGGNCRCHKAAKSGKFPRAIAAKSGNFIAAFCHVLPPGFGRHFFPTDTLGDGVIKN
jgi:hypothetical protein